MGQDESQQPQVYIPSAKQPQRRKECPFAQSSSTQPGAQSDWSGLGGMLDPEPISEIWSGTL